MLIIRLDLQSRCHNLTCADSDRKILIVRHLNEKNMLFSYVFVRYFLSRQRYK